MRIVAERAIVRPAALAASGTASSMPVSAKKQNGAAFDSEAQLVETLLGIVGRRTTPWGRLQTVTEWDYRTGITDVLARTPCNELIAFEAKLSDWRRGCHQAYKNTTFAVRAYVVLPEPVAVRAEAYSETFARYGIGLCACSTRNISVLIEARAKEPLMAWLTNRAHTTFDGMLDANTNGLGGRRRIRLQAA